MNLSAPIEGLFPGLRGRVLTALVRSARPISLRELARRAQSPDSPTSVKRVLLDLIEQGIVVVALASKGGQFYELNRTNLMAAHLIEMDHAKDEVLAEIRSLVDRWSRQPRAVVLFGSVARHDDTASSDVDLLIVWADDDVNAPRWDAEKLELMSAVQALSGNVLNIVEFSSAAWSSACESGEPLVNEIARDGVSVVGEHVRSLTGQGAMGRTQ